MALPGVVPEGIAHRAAAAEAQVVEPAAVAGAPAVLLYIPKSPEFPAHMVKHPIQHHADAAFMQTAAYGAEGVPVSQALVDLIIVLGVIAVLAGLKHRPQIHSVYPQLLEMGNPVHQLFDPVDPFPVGVEAGRSAEAERINMIKYGFCNPIHHESLLPWSDL